MLRIIKFVSDNIKHVKTIAVIISCFALAATAFHDEWDKQFPSKSE